MKNFSIVQNKVLNIAYYITKQGIGYHMCNDNY